MVPVLMGLVEVDDKVISQRVSAEEVMRAKITSNQGARSNKTKKDKTRPRSRG